MNLPEGFPFIPPGLKGGGYDERGQLAFEKLYPELTKQIFYGSQLVKLAIDSAKEK